MFVEPERVFAAVATMRRSFAALSSPTLSVASASNTSMSAVLTDMCVIVNGFLGRVAPRVEAIAQAFTVGAIDTERADGGC